MADTYAVIEFEDADSWVRVRLTGVPMSTYESVVDAVDTVYRRFMPDELRALREVFAPLVESWSFPEPVGVEGLAARDPNWLLAVVREWASGVRSVPLPLPRRSSAGDTSASDQNPET
jgi:hypothetical protein